MMLSILSSIGERADARVGFLIHRGSARSREEIHLRCPWLEVFEHGLDPTRGSWMKSSQIHEWLRCVGLIRKFRPNRLVALSGGCEGAWRANVLGSFAGVPVTQYLPNTRTMASLGAKFGTLRDSLALASLRMADRIVVIADHQQEFLRSRGFRKSSTRVFKNFMPDPVVETPRLSPSRRLRVGVVGRIDYFGKGFDILARLVGSGVARHEYHVVGDGPDRARVERELARAIDDGTVRMHGWSDPWRLDLDVLFLPTRMEGVPLVIIEAVLRSVPVLGSDLPELRELLPRQWLFDREKTLDIEALLSDIHGDRDSDRMRILVATYRREYVRKPNFEEVSEVFGLPRGG